MDLQLEGSTVLVTGASGGIGRALAEAFAAEGACLVLHGFTAFEALQTWTSEQPWCERALCVRANVADPQEVEAAFAQASERFGRIDACVANAGVWPKQDLRLDQASIERIRGAVDANLFGATWTARSFMAQLERHGAREDGRGASLCFIGSTAGHFGERGHAEYSLAKAGLYGLVRSLKNEIVALDPFARVNMVEPGWTVTHMVREELEQEGAIARNVRGQSLRQLARAQDIARAVLFLSSPAMARHVSGQVLTVAGGMEGRTLWEREQIDEDAVRRRLSED